MTDTTQNENEQIKLRREKLTAMRESGTNPFPNDFRRNIVAAEILARYEGKENEELEDEQVRVKVAGRMMSRRIMGKASFAHVEDMSGRIQLYVQRDSLPDGFYNTCFKKWDIGDIIGVEGVLFRTKTGELTIRVDDIQLLVKSLRPLPEKYHGLTDLEMRYRQRYVDLIMSQASRDSFRKRTRIISLIREYLADRDFLEVETPMMQAVPGGAAARPFKTFHNALNIDLFMRIAPELYLKRLVVGGFERVFEINRNFRNEGLSTRHNPEFTMVEFYQAYADYKELMDLTEDMLRHITETIQNNNTVVSYQGDEYDFGKPFTRMTVKEAVLKYNKQLSADQLEDKDALRKYAESLKIPLRDSYGAGKLLIEIFEKTGEHLLKDPTFITAYPVEVSPLSRRNDEDPDVTDRFELFIGGREIANGFSELNDPEDQVERFRDQLKQKEEGDEEAMSYDADFIRALEHGMPPTAGEGIGIDRLVMLFTDSPSIRDVLLFPHMRPEAEG
ncbi:MAG TPA: lysine--tRNA ligase [Gammaproteobacteria bacterium]|nr:lysine--tRNA ligase [Gammaproteobacteria bacterium]